MLLPVLTRLVEVEGFAPQTTVRNICPGPACPDSVRVEKVIKGSKRAKVGQDKATVVSVLSEAHLMVFHWFHAMGATLGC